MVAILDQTADSTRQEFVRFSRLYSLPEYVKQASQADTLDADSNLPATAFADTRNRQFKCHTKAATFVSYLYFLEKRGQLHPKVAEWIGERLNQFVDHWGIRGDIEQLLAKHAEHNKDNLTDDDYMLVWASEDGRKERRYTLRNSAEVKAAADWFRQYRDHFAYYDRKVMAGKLLEKAAQLGVTLSEDMDEMLERQAGRGTYLPKEAAQFLRDRAAAAPQKTPKAFIEKMAELANQVAINGHLAADPTSIAQLCHTVDTFDRFTKLAGHYTALLPRPEDVFCKALFKVARAAVDEAVQLTTGNVYNRNDLETLKLSELQDVFGNDIANECATGYQIDGQKVAEIFPTFPRHDADVLDRVLEANGIRPMAKTATAVDRPQFALLRQLAAVDRMASGA